MMEYMLQFVQFKVQLVPKRCEFALEAHFCLSQTRGCGFLLLLREFLHDTRLALRHGNVHTRLIPLCLQCAKFLHMRSIHLFCLQNHVLDHFLTQKLTIRSIGTRSNGVVRIALLQFT